MVVTPKDHEESLRVEDRMIQRNDRKVGLG